jgi:hypothetical protein
MNRYSLAPRHRPLTYNADGSYPRRRAKSPGKDKEGNWLPAPNGMFSLYIRAYWPDQAVLDGTWTPPKIEKVRLTNPHKGSAQ